MSDSHSTSEVNFRPIPGDILSRSGVLVPFLEPVYICVMPRKRTPRKLALRSWRIVELARRADTSER
jgi:hypothetical protein